MKYLEIFSFIFPVTTFVNVVVAGGKLVSPEMCISYRIIDDDGSPVSDVSCRGWIREFDAKDGGHSYFLKSDTNGLVTISGKCSVSFTAFFTKEGYYMTRFEPCLDEDGLGSAIFDGKWQPYGETRTVMLKRILQPHEMYVPEMPPQRKIRIYDKWLDFDLENGDFLPPMGNGRNADMLVRFKLKGQMPYDWSIKMDVSFTNHPCAGAYVLKKDVWSDMKSVYFADTNALYLTDFSFQYAREKGSRRPVVEKLGEDEYLVFRTRTKVDHDGRLISARYGKLYGPWNFEDAGGSQIQKVFLNKADNDANLEDAETARRARLSYRQRQELEWRRKNGLR